MSGISGISGQTSPAIQQLVDMRSQFDNLQQQLSTGQKSQTFAGLGIDRGVTVTVNAQLSAIDGYDNTIDNVTNSINLMNLSISRMTDITTAIKSSIAQANTTNSPDAVSAAQQTAQSSLDELLGLLNTQDGSTYLFSGKATNTPAVGTYDQIINGNGTQAGLKQIITERNQADLGSNGLGRLVITQPTGKSVQVAEDAVSPFGLKLASVSSTLTNATVTGPTGSPATLKVDMSAGNPNDGDTLTVRFNLPDGTTQNLTLTATTNSPPGDNEFTIGATPTATAANLSNALSTAIGTISGGALAAASAVAASNDFFNADSNNPPQRVVGPPFNTATALTSGTASNTVIWYQGDDGSDPARSTSTARIDQNLSVSYGARANEQGIRTLVQNIATLAATDLSSTNPHAADLSAALNQRLTTNIDGTPGSQTLENISVDLAGAQSTMAAAKTRHQQSSSTLQTYLSQIEGVSSEGVGTELLALQTRMQASMQTTAMLYQTTLVNYLPK